MPVVEMIPWIDIFLAVFFLGLIAIGFWQGMLKEFWVLLSLYLSMILASLYGDAVAVFLIRRTGLGVPEVASAWGFVIVLLLGTGIIFSILYGLVGHLRLPASLTALDKIGGVILGVVMSLLLTTFFAFLLNALIPVGPVEWAFATALQKQRVTSPLLRLFLSTRFLVVSTVQIWLPSGFELPRFLTIR
ncbi:MAG: CvpA family protein [Chloroflexia bacterium]|nr:CvpA family protein [Chloroflexia bacterium]